MKNDKKLSQDLCSIDGCNGKHIAKGLCNKHYLRLKNGGSLELVGRAKKTPEQVLMDGSRVMENGCIEWIKSKRQGYGRLMILGKSHSAHVLSWKLKNGEIPEGLQINHRCNNRACINTDHLYTGTQTQNMADMLSAGRERRARGIDIASSKLTEEKVLKIRESNKSKASLARQYGVSESLIRSVVNRQSWAWL